MSKKEQVNHPAHYNGRKDGLECISIIRHYTYNIGAAIKYLWRAGLKHSAGKTDRAKEIEDLRKAVWYIRDYTANLNMLSSYLISYTQIDQYLYKSTKRDAKSVAGVYEKDVADAMMYLLRNGLMYNGMTFGSITQSTDLTMAVTCIERRIGKLEKGADHA